MFRFRARSIRRAVALVAIVIIRTSDLAVAQNVSGKLYRCISKDAVVLQDNGSLGRYTASEFSRKLYDGIVIDTLTGAITWAGASGTRQLWRVVGKGGDYNDHILIPEPPFSGLDLAPIAATDFIRVRDWAQNKQVTFLAFALSTLVTGTCE